MLSNEQKTNEHRIPKIRFSYRYVNACIVYILSSFVLPRKVLCNALQFRKHMRKWEVGLHCDHNYYRKKSCIRQKRNKIWHSNVTWGQSRKKNLVLKDQSSLESLNGELPEFSIITMKKFSRNWSNVPSRNL